MQARMVCLVPLVMSLHYIILICHFTSHHFTSLHITSLHITSYDIMVISDIMGHVGVMLWHLKGHRGDLTAGPPWGLHDYCMRPAWLGRVKFWHIFWRPFLEAQVGQHVPKGCQNGTKKCPTSDNFRKMKTSILAAIYYTWATLTPPRALPKLMRKSDHTST